MSAAAGQIGLYSISVRGLDVPGLLTWAADHAIPFIHLRGGPRGFDVTRRPRAQLRSWRRQAAGSAVPVTGVTGDIDLADALACSPDTRSRTARDLTGLTAAASELGAGWVRLLARTPPGPGWQPDVQRAFPVTAVPLVIEAHHPGWLEPANFAALARLVDRDPRLHLLADTAQLAALPPGNASPAEHACLLSEAVSRATVLHLSHSSTLAAAGHAAVAELAARRIRAGHRIEIAVEWTGADRSPEEALRQYRQAAAWWTRIYEQTGRSASQRGRIT